MNQNPSIVVIGATGMLGSRVTRVLSDQGFSVTAAVRNPDKAARMRVLKGINTVKADLKDPESLDVAFEGADFLYLNLSTAPVERSAPFKTETDGVKNAIHAARKAGIKRIGFLSSLVKDFTENSWWVFDIKREAVDHLLKSGIPVTIFYPSNFFENLTELQMKENKILIAGRQETQSWWIGTEDFGRQVAAAFRQDHNDNREYPVQGLQPFSMDEAADEFITHYSPKKLKKSRAPMWIFKLLKPFSKTIHFQYNILNAINRYDEQFQSEKTWEELGKPLIKLRDYAQSFGKR